MPKPRIVPVIVTDPRVKMISPVEVGPDGKPQFLLNEEGKVPWIPVPEDDQLREWLDTITRWALGDFPSDEREQMDEAAWDAAPRLRAAFSLDTEDEDGSDRTVPYEPDEVCDLCGKVGAYDFYGDVVCEDCADRANLRHLDTEDDNE